jgi:hypothetical protein
VTTPAGRLIPLAERTEWELALQSVPHAFAHTWASCRAMNMTTGWPTYLYVWEDGTDRVVCAVSERGQGSDVDVVTPYGFGGFAGTATNTDFLDDWAKHARTRRYVCGYIGLNPLLAPPELSQRNDYVEHSRIYVLDLRKGIETLRGELSPDRRKKLARMDRDGARVIDDQPRLRSYFLANIAAFLSSRGAGSVYAFTTSTWEALVDSDGVFLLGVESASGELVTAYLFAHTPFCAENLFSVTTPVGRGYTTALLWEGIRRVRDLEVPWLNLGGGASPGDPIDYFKQRFGGTALPLGSLQQIYSPDVFARLSARAGVEASRTSYFPPYRSPAAVRSETDRLKPA